MSIDKRLKDLDIILPSAKPPVGAYIGTKIIGNLLYVSGQVSIDEKSNLIKGKLGKDLNVEQIPTLIELCNKTFDYSTPLSVKKLLLIEYSEEKGEKIIGRLNLKKLV